MTPLELVDELVVVLPLVPLAPDDVDDPPPLLELELVLVPPLVLDEDVPEEVPDVPLELVLDDDVVVPWLPLVPLELVDEATPPPAELELELEEEPVLELDELDPLPESWWTVLESPPESLLVDESKNEPESVKALGLTLPSSGPATSVSSEVPQPPNTPRIVARIAEPMVAPTRTFMGARLSSRRRIVAPSRSVLLPARRRGAG